MAKIELKFLDASDSSTIQAYINLDGNISIYSSTNDEYNEGVCVHLDVPTAIKFAKTLRTEINKAKGI